MSHEVLLDLASVLVLGILSQWLAWRLRLPSIVLLMSAGLVAGPLTGLLRPDELFGPLLLPAVSLAVAVILFEGGLSLKFSDLHAVGSVFLRLMTAGALITWLVGAVAAHWILGLGWAAAAMLGSILVVTGPTVIGPMLRHLRLNRKVAALLKWEGIGIDPVGAMLAVIVFAVLKSEQVEWGAAAAAWAFGMTLAVGLCIGLAGAAALTVCLRRYWIPDSLQNAVSLMMVVAAHVSANLLQDEAGLMAVTIMGIALANQRDVAIRHLVEFKENLTILLISCLFIVLAARLELEDLRSIGPSSFLFLAALIVVARPVCVFVSAVGSQLNWRERLMLAWMAPRGIVAAAITSVFALEMEAAGFAEATAMAPNAFLVVFGTVLFYGLTAGPVARRLGLAHRDPQGVMFVGAHPLARALAQALRAEGCPAVLVDTDRESITLARLSNLPAYHGSILSEHVMADLDYGELGRMLAMTPNNEVNSLACLRLIEVFGRKAVYQLPFARSNHQRHEAVSREQRGRLLFNKEWTYSALEDCSGDDPEVKRTRLSEKFTFQDFLATQGNELLPVFVRKPDGRLLIAAADEPLAPLPGDLLFSLSVRTPRPAAGPTS